MCAVGCDYSAIQPAVDAAPGSGTVMVGAGTYVGSVRLERGVDLIGAVDAVAEPGAIPQVTVVGDAGTPAVTVGAHSELRHVIIKAGSPSWPAVEFSVPDVHHTSTTATISDARTYGGSVGMLVGSGSDVTMSATVVEAPAETGIRIAPGTAGASIAISHGLDVLEAPLGLELAERSQVAAEQLRVTVPEGGTAIRLGAMSSFTVTGATFDGAGRAGSTGIETGGASFQALVVGGSHFVRLAHSIRISGAGIPGTEGVQLSGNDFVTGDASPPIWFDVARSAAIVSNYVDCPIQACPTVGGAVASDTLVDALEPRIVSTDDRSDVTNGTASANSDLGLSLLLVSSSHPEGSVLATALGGRPGYFELNAVHTGEPGQDLDIQGRVGQRPVTARVHLLGSPPKQVSKGRIEGVARIGRVLTCIPPRWNVLPDSVTYAWSGGGTERTKILGHDDVVEFGVTCSVVARFRDYRVAGAKVAVLTVKEPLRLRLYGLGPTWRITACGASVSHPCAAKRRFGIRFWLYSPSQKPQRATITLERRQGRKWVRWVGGTAKLPLSGGLFVPAKLAGPGTYRLQLRVAAHDMYAPGVTRWLVWRVS